MSDLTHYDDNITVEWINGVKCITPSPHPNHSRVYIEILTSLSIYLKGKDCKVFPDKVDLCLSDPNQPINISDLRKPLVPDMFVVCNNKFELVGNNIVAIPDFICEIVSPSSIKMDKEIKRDLYLSKGVREYWVVDYFEKSIIVYFKGDKIVYSFNDDVKVNILDNLTICLKDVELFQL